MKIKRAREAFSNKKSATESCKYWRNKGYICTIRKRKGKMRYYVYIYPKRKRYRR